MTTREVVDLTLVRSQGKDRLKQRLADRQRRFPKEFARLSDPANSYGIRATAAPVVEGHRLESVFRRRDIDAPRCKVTYVSRDGSEVLLGAPFEFRPWKPQQRAARSEYSSLLEGQLEFHSYQEIHCDGLIEFSLLTCPGSDEYAFFPSWLITMFVTLATWADRVRNAASSPSLEYALDIEMYANGEIVPVRWYYEDFLGRKRTFGGIGSNQIRLDYSLAGSSDIAEMAAVFAQDFWNSIGEDYGFNNGRFMLMPPEEEARWE